MVAGAPAGGGQEMPGMLSEPWAAAPVMPAATVMTVAVESAVNHFGALIVKNVISYIYTQR